MRQRELARGTWTTVLGWALGIVALLAGLAASAGEVYVSPDGNDSNPGTKEKPLATLARARDVVRGLKQAETGPVTVYLRGGTYYLPQTLVFTAEDSGTADAPVVYAAYPGEEPVISGGMRLEFQWSASRDGIMQADVPADFVTDQLFVNDRRLPMARYPNFDASAQYFNGFAADAFSPQRAARWKDPAGGFIHAMHRAHWGDFHYRITGKNEAGEVTYVGGWQNNRRMGMHGSHRFVENIFEELDAPGEWFLDQHQHVLWCMPPEGVDLTAAKVESARLAHLIELRGSEQQPVRFMRLEGLTLRHTARTFMENKEPLLRSDWTTYRGGAIVFDGAEDCEVRNAFLDAVGSNGIFVNNYNRRITITGCKILNAGASSISLVGDPGAVRNPLFEYGQRQSFESIDREVGPKTNNYPADCLVHDNLLVRSGRFEKQTAGVNISMAMEITVSHNSVYDVPRAGINICDGTWGGHLIEHNDVFDTVKETGDHGSFNSWGRDRFWGLTGVNLAELVKEYPELPKWDAFKTTVIRNNRWRCDHGWDIDLDDGSSNYRLYNNLCLNGGIKNREGFYRTDENNIMVNNGFHPHCWFEGSGDVFRRNIVFKAYRPARMSARDPWGGEMDYNLAHSVDKTGPAVELQAGSKRDEHSVYGDAMFVDPAAGDFQVAEGSPALALGFENFPMDDFGVLKPELRREARTPRITGYGEATAPKTAGTRDDRKHPWMGAVIKNLVGLGEMSATGMGRETGVLVVEVPPGSAAARAGFREGDVILAIGRKSTNDVKQFMQAIGTSAKGDTIRVVVHRNQKKVQVSFERRE